MLNLDELARVAQGMHSGFLSPMTIKEAAKILGLGRSWGAEEINKNYRMLLMRNHPDRGGSEFIAQKLNEARAMLQNM